ncbi:hypothetical protein BDN70DRAFT_939354 [Pholiota conissans]|uniref:F-box domain-containing protein n=1 Tax=Pholiota conissans TaxID=109636 RepID=A0A9P5YLA6_9AGAR|nr:hypothetical protein BDN70DRAFT_939354 [Pholiota conissans]
MSNDPFSSLPEEMLEEISKFFQRGDVVTEPHKSYSALAQTCKTLRPYFQRRLFTNVDLTAEIRIRTFAKLVQVNPILASYVQTILLPANHMYMGLFQYPPLLTIMHAVNTASYSGTLPEIHLCIEHQYVLTDQNLPPNIFTYILYAPQNILDAITKLTAGQSAAAFPVGLFRLLPNLRQLCGYHLILSSIIDYNPSAEYRTPEYFRPKLNKLSLGGIYTTTIRMLSEQILDLSTVKDLEIFSIKSESTSGAYPNSKNFLAQRLLDRAQSVEKLHLDIGVMVGSFYDLGQLQRLRECTLDIDVEVGKNPVPHLCQLLRTLPPLPEHDLEYLCLSIQLTDNLLDENNVADSQLLFSINTWSKFDTALVDVVSSGTRPFKLMLAFYIGTQSFYSVQPLLKDLFVNWGRNFLPRSSQQQNLNIHIFHLSSF